jgi:hypothetical protein
MRARLILTAVAAGCVCASAIAAEHDYYKYLRYPKGLVPGVGLDKVEAGFDSVLAELREKGITDDELEALKEIAEQLLARTGTQLDDAVQDGSFQEICHDIKIQG